MTALILQIAEQLASQDGAGTDYVELRPVSGSGPALADLETALGAPPSELPRIAGLRSRRFLFALGSGAVRVTVCADVDETGRAIAVIVRRDAI